MKTPIVGLADFTALDPFFRIIEQGLAGLAGPGHFFDLLGWGGFDVKLVALSVCRVPGAIQRACPTPFTVFLKSIASEFNPLR